MFKQSISLCASIGAPLIIAVMILAVNLQDPATKSMPKVPEKSNDDQLVAAEQICYDHEGKPFVVSPRSSMLTSPPFELAMLARLTN